MDAHYDSQIRLQSHHQTAFGGPARQFGSGGMGAFAMRMGRVAVPLVKKYVLAVAKEFGKNLILLLFLTVKRCFRKKETSQSFERHFGKKCNENNVDRRRPGDD